MLHCFKIILLVEQDLQCSAIKGTLENTLLPEVT